MLHGSQELTLGANRSKRGTQDKPDFNQKGKGVPRFFFFFPFQLSPSRNLWRSLGEKNLQTLVPRATPRRGGRGRHLELSRQRPARAPARRGRSRSRTPRGRAPEWFISNSGFARLHRGRRPSTSHGCYPGPSALKQPPASPRSPSGSGREGDLKPSGWKAATSPASATMAGATPCPRPQTDFLESTGLGLPDWRPLRPPTSFTNLPGLPAARFPVPARPPASASQGVVGSTRRRSPDSTALVPTPPPDARAHSQVAGASWEL